MVLLPVFRKRSGKQLQWQPTLSNLFIFHKKSAVNVNWENIEPDKGKLLENALALPAHRGSYRVAN